MKNYNLKTVAKVLIVIVVAVLILYGIRESSVEIANNTVKISGMYGFSMAKEEIENIELLNELPKISFKKNGISIFGIHKGVYKVDGYDRIKLFVYGEGPFILIESEESPAIVSFRDENKTKELYQNLADFLGNN